jgi:putative ABC transport system substrate-binding protein
VGTADAGRRISSCRLVGRECRYREIIFADAGYVDGRNVTLEYRWADGHRERLPELAADLIRRGVAVIATPSNPSAALAAKAATSSIPIVFSMGGDPVAAGLVDSYNRPGANITGISSLNMELVAKRIGLLHELAPKALRIGVLLNASSPSTLQQVADAQAAVSAISGKLQVLSVERISDIEPAVTTLVRIGIDALVITPGEPFAEYRPELVALAQIHKLPAMYAVRSWANIGGLMTYGPDVADEFRQAGIYTGRILKGEKPADLPIVRPTKFELVINAKTAKSLGLTVPPSLLATADEVIE